jgi:hypothetical protein
VPLPTADTPWPPPELHDAFDRIAVWSAWYSGDPKELAKAYERYTHGSIRPSDRPSQYRGGIVGAVSRMFWGQPTPPGERRTKLHVPIASDMASTSADLLFSEPVKLEAAEGANDATQERLDGIAEATHATLLEGAEVAAGLGGVFALAAWDTTFDPEGPWLHMVHADAAVPEWRYGRLWAVTTWREVARDGAKVVRHLERHERGVILHAVYEGTETHLGTERALSRYPDTAGLESSVNTGIDLLTASYIPNIRPNKIWRAIPVACHLGRSDYLGTEPLMDALDEVYSAMMRDVRLGKARAMIPETMLQTSGPGSGASFDAEREYFTGLNMLTKADGSGNAITLSQPEIRHEAYTRIGLDLIGRIVGTAGYSGQTFGIVAEGEGAATATETAARTRKSLITRDKKGLYWVPEIAHLAQVLCQLGNEHFAWGVSDDRPKALLPDAVQPTMRELAESADLLLRGGAASVETRVRLVGLVGADDEAVDAEVKLIEKELGVGLVPAADTFGADPNADPQSEDPSGEAA